MKKSKSLVGLIPLAATVVISFDHLLFVAASHQNDEVKVTDLESERLRTRKIDVTNQEDRSSRQTYNYNQDGDIINNDNRRSLQASSFLATLRQNFSPKAPTNDDDDDDDDEEDDDGENAPTPTTGSPTTATPTLAPTTLKPTTSTNVKSTLSSSDVVTDWNKVLLSSVTTTSPPRASRAMGMVHVAMFEAINGIANEFNPYYMGVVKPSSSASAIAAAATVLIKYCRHSFPQTWQRLMLSLHSH